jgi:predicted metal-dependent enzyme (double-stranded beta helix superfamily)
MRHGYALEALIRDLDAAVAGNVQDPQALTARAMPVLERFVSDARWLEGRGDRDRVTSSPRHLLYRAPDLTYSVWSMVFLPGCATPIHEHHEWGLVGVWHGMEQEERFTAGADSIIEGGLNLRATGVRVNERGSVTLLVPPVHNVHRITNVSDTPAYSIHVYGRTDPAQPSRSYDLETGRAMTWEEDPLGAARAWGLSVTLADFKTLLGTPDLSDAEMLDELRIRLSKAQPDQ